MKKATVMPVAVGRTIGLTLLLLLSTSCADASRRAGDVDSAARVSGSSQGYEARTFVVTDVAGMIWFEENTYLLVDSRSGQALLIDPGSRSGALEEYVAARGLRIGAILNTHGHYDHIGANGYYRSLYNVEVYASARDAPLYSKQDVPVDPENAPTLPFPAQGDLTIGAMRLRVIPTPGHTPGSVCLLAGDALFSGDTLFRDSVGRTRDDDAARTLVASIRDGLFALPSATLVYPGHGEPSTIGEERAHNPFL